MRIAALSDHVRADIGSWEAYPRLAMFGRISRFAKLMKPC
jgi:hypothetical protein